MIANKQRTNEPLMHLTIKEIQTHSFAFKFATGCGLVPALALYL